MNSASRTVQRVVWSILGAVIVLVVVLYVREQSGKSKLPVFGQIAPFTLTNQLGRPVSLQELQGKVWVADIVFARCAGPCPRMTEEMSKLHKTFGGEESLHFVTLTTDPENDSPAVLKEYSERFDADPSRWHFLTGSKSEIKSVALGSLKLAAVEKSEDQQQNENDLFIHSTTFVLIDRQARLRGVYESLEPGFQEKISTDIKALLRER